MKIILWFFTFFFTPLFLTAQSYHSLDGEVSFQSDVVLELIKSSTKNTYSTLNTGSGKVSCNLKVSDFEFNKPMMYKHFNENYLESHLYPNAKFIGYIMNRRGVDFLIPGDYTISIEGELEIHGVTRQIMVESVVQVRAKKIHMKTSFEVDLADYKIMIPDFVKNNIAKKIIITMDVVFQDSLKLN